ncbi:acyl-CoA N-acyltransferase [Aspergillus caelatus]|uniref:Acyl-CoA N-acyltransferase n=1 Tax=Aspergillus caelatus TaxID=61420 RepID=A0A5N7A8Q3_9EURO|nr:acyl-CoA N-acyltransferase [Aspergillus caelatus]KAE8366234.1 acyl-CoA N-acyltransferase [Aspergillus caelatus]
MSLDLKPRLATSSDKLTIATLVNEAYTPYIERIGRKPGPMLEDYGAQIDAGRVYVVEKEGVMSGILVLIPEEGTMLLDNVAVAPAAQGVGLGKRLMGFAEGKARESGFERIRLYTNEKMVENLRIYERLGYVETHRGWENGLRRVYMVKVLH